MKKSYLFAHHSAFKSNEPQFDLINTWHKNKGFPISSLGFYVGYMYVIEKNGLIKRGRNDDEMGSHTVAKGHNFNRDGIGVCFAGDFTKELPTAQQLKAWENLGKIIVQEESILLENILNHRDVKPTECPAYDFATHLRVFLKAKPQPYTPTFLTYEQQLKGVLKALTRATGSRKFALERKRDRLLKRI